MVAIRTPLSLLQCMPRLLNRAQPWWGCGGEKFGLRCLLRGRAGEPVEDLDEKNRGQQRLFAIEIPANGTLFFQPIIGTFRAGGR